MIILRLLLGLGIGAGFGALMGLGRSCETGACPLTANPLRGAIYGAVLGLLFALTLSAPGSSVRQNDAKGASQTAVSSGDSEQNQLEELNEENFKNVIGEGVVLVDFWAPWCGPCRQQAPILEDLAENADADVTIAKVNVDDNQKISREYRVTGIPTLILFSDGKPVERFVGLQSQRVLEAAIEKASSESAVD